MLIGCEHIEAMAQTPRDELAGRLHDLLQPLATEHGGRAVIAALGSDPPAIALLATGSILFDGERIEIVTERSSSFATAHPRNGATLVIADEVSVLRASIAPLATDFFEDLAVVSGPLVSIRPSIEMPWALQLRFTPTDLAARRPFLDYWSSTRRWLLDGCRGSPPQHPRST